MRNLNASVAVAALAAGARDYSIKSGGDDNAAQPSMRELADLVKSTGERLTRASDDAKRAAEKAAKDVADAGVASVETKAAADKALAETAELRETLAELGTKMARLEGGNRGGDADGEKSIGYQVAESDEVKSFAAGGSHGRVKVSVKAVTSLAGSAGALIAADRRPVIVEIPRARLTIRDLVLKGRTNSNMIEFVRELGFVNNAAVVAEGALKPESGITFEKADAPVRTIAHWTHVSRQAMDDAPRLATIIDSRLRWGLDYAEEREMLYGDGTGEHLHGIVPQAPAYAAAFAVDGETPIDRLRLSFLQSELAEYPVDGAVLNPLDWARIELTKDANGGYIFANPVGIAGPVLWGRRIVATKSMTVDKFLTGAFGMAAEIADRMDTEVLISSEDRDNFVKNMLTVRGERRLAFAVIRPEAFNYGDFGFVA